jgi:hypothetical protein
MEAGHFPCLRVKIFFVRFVICYYHRLAFCI